MKRMKSFLTALAIVFAVISPVSPADANGVNAGVTSTGYLYIQNYANNGIDRYNIATGQSEALNLSDATCQALDRDEIYDIAVDATRFKLYWSNFQSGPYPNYRSQINELDLKTGICTGLVNTPYVYSSGAEYFSYAGIALDSTNNRLYFADEGGASTATAAGAWQNRNRSLRYLDLNASNNRDRTIELTNEQYTYTIGFARDVAIDGDYVWMVGKLFDSPGNKNSGDGVFKVQVTTGNVVATTANITNVVSYEENTTDINQVAVRGTNVFFSANGNSAGYNRGVLRFSQSEQYPSPVEIIPVSNGAPNPTGHRTYNGFALGQGDEMFTMDFRAGWGDMGFYSSHEGANAAEMAGTYNSGGTYWGMFIYSDALLPAAPVISSVARTADTTATINFTAPTGADVDGNYPWRAIPDGGGSELTGTCATSPCDVTGLAAGVHYNFSMKHVFRNAGAQAIIGSNFGTPVLDAVPVVTDVVRSFTGFPTMKSGLSAAQKRAIRAWVTANPTKTTATCVGQVGYNWANVSRAELKFLANNRAKNVCTYIHAVKPSITTTVSTSIISKSKQSSIRLVSVTLR